MINLTQQCLRLREIGVEIARLSKESRALRKNIGRDVGVQPDDVLRFHFPQTGHVTVAEIKNVEGDFTVTFLDVPSAEQLMDDSPDA